MTDYYCDESLSTGLNDGTSQANAWQSMATAFTSGITGEGDIIWFRRNTTHTASADIQPNITGAVDDPWKAIAWPRNSHSISSSDWTHGSTSVTVDDADMDRLKHCGRWITGPDGRDYLITRVISTTSIVIDREYIGSTVSNNATAVIKADDDYADRPTDVAGWDSDSDTLPVIDFNAGNYNFYNHSCVHGVIKGFEFKNSTDTYGVLWCRTLQTFKLVNCFFSGTANSRLVFLYGGFDDIVFDRCIFVGSSAGSSQVGITIFYGTAGTLKNSAIYNMGDNGIEGSSGIFKLENVNIGVEQANDDEDIGFISGNLKVVGKDVKLGATNGAFEVSSSTKTNAETYLKIENYQKVLGDHIMSNLLFEAVSADVVAGSGDPYKRTSGADKIISITSDTYDLSEAEGYVLPPVFEHFFDADTTSKTYRYYCQADAMSTLATELWLEAEYVSAYDDTSEYQYSKINSDETISTRSGASDWSQYLEVTVQPAVASVVRIKLFATFYDADGTLHIDPLPVIS